MDIVLHLKLIWIVHRIFFLEKWKVDSSFLIFLSWSYFLYRLAIITPRYLFYDFYIFDVSLAGHKTLLHFDHVL